MIVLGILEISVVVSAMVTFSLVRGRKSVKVMPEKSFWREFLTVPSLLWAIFSGIIILMASDHISIVNRIWISVDEEYGDFLFWTLLLSSCLIAAIIRVSIGALGFMTAPQTSAGLDIYEHFDEGRH